MAILAVACKPEPTLEVGISTMGVGCKDVKVETVSILSNLDWAITTDVDWITVNPAFGTGSGEFTITIDDNIAPEGQKSEDRYATITVSAGVLQETIEVHQFGEDKVFEVGEGATLEAAGGQITVKVEANLAYEVSISEAWITRAETKAVKTDNLVFNVAAYDGFDAPRTGTITISPSKGDLKTVTVTQNPGKRFASGSGTEADPWVIMDAAQLNRVRDVLDTTRHSYFKLGADIDLKEYDPWVPLTVENLDYRLYLDGQNHTISNMKVSGTKYAGFVGLLTGGLKNIKFDSCTSTGTGGSSAGIIGGWMGNNNASLTATLENVTCTNCMVQSDAAANGSNATVGGLCGNAGGTTFKNCSFQGELNETNANAEGAAGGICGHSYVACVFENCSFQGLINSNGSRNIGGICGKAEWKKNAEGTVVAVPEFKNCKSDGIITSTRDLIGGIAAWIGGGNVTGCSSTMTLNVSKNASSNYGYSGGIIGYSTSGSEVVIDNCQYDGDIVLATNANVSAGIIGQSASKITITNCTSKGSIKGSASFLAGMIAYTNNGGSLEITKCSSTMEFNGVGYIGGMFGQGNAAVTSVKIDRCHYNGNITGTGSQLGGIIGRDNNSVVAISNCIAEGTITGGNMDMGGLSGINSKGSSITNSIALNTLVGAYSFGGIIARCCNGQNIGTNLSVSTNNTIKGCIAWNPSMTSTKKTAPATGYSTGAVVGFSGLLNTLEDCVRRPDMVFECFPDTKYDVLVDHENANAENPLARAFTNATDDKYYAPYNGKVAAEGETASQVAKRLGWDETIWDLSGSVPALK